jgi:cyclomaltodextrinase / maltogenic alpha-amylase / neopullulanase
MPDWVADAIVYQAIPDRLEPPRPEHLARYARAAFDAWDAPPQDKRYKGGTLWGVRAHLPRIRALGATALYLTPVLASPTYHRYKPVDLFRVDPLLGGDEALAALLAEAHALGLKVVLDFVVNHVGAGFLPFADVVEYGEASPYRDWFHLEGGPVRPFALQRGFRSWNQNASMPVLDHANPAVRAHVIEAAIALVRRGVDGLRLDAASEVEEAALFDELREAVERERGEVWLLGEAWSDPRRLLEGKRCHGATNYPLHFSARAFAGRGRLRHERLHAGAVPEGGIDAKEHARRLLAIEHGLEPRAVRSGLVFLDGHDVARFRAVVSGDTRCERLARLLLCTERGAFGVYYGEEAGLSGGLPPGCREGLPREEQFDAQALEDVRAAIALRRSHEALRRGGRRILHAEGGLFAALHSLPRDAVLVAANASDAPARLALEAAALPAGSLERLRSALSVGEARPICEGGALTLELAPRSGIALDLLGGGRAPEVSTLAPAVAVVGNIGIDTNVYLPPWFEGFKLESTFTEDLDTIGQAGGYSAFGFARLGLRTRLIAAVGEDASGRWIREELQAAGIEHFLATDPQGTQRSVNLMAPDGTRKNFYDGKGHMTLLPDLERAKGLLAGARLAHFHLPNWARKLLSVARELGVVVSVDLQDMTGPRDAYRDDFIDAADYLFCSAVNLPPRELASALVQRNPRATVVLGLGARGAAACTAQEGYREFAPVQGAGAIVDTNGCGDSLAAGFLTARVLEGQEVAEAIRWGQTCARHAATLKQKWRRLLTRPELEARLRGEQV